MQEEMLEIQSLSFGKDPGAKDAPELEAAKTRRTKVVSLLDLPNELLQAIFGYVPIYGVSNFSLTSKFVFAVCKNIVYEDQRLRRTYSNLNFYETRLSDDPRLADIITQPRFGLYTRTMMVSGVQHGPLARAPDYNNNYILAPCPGVLRRMSYSLSVITFAQIRKGIRLNQADAILIFLIPALVNLRSIRIVIHASADLLTGLAKLLGPTGPAIKSVQVLPNLRCCTIESTHMSIHTEIKTAVVTGLALLPSLRFLSFSNVRSLTNGGFAWSQSRTSMVTELSLHSCQLGLKALRSLLSRFKFLVSFELNHQAIRSDLCDVKQPGQIIDALPQSVQHTLEHLTLRVQPTWPSDATGNDFMKLLHDFTALKTIRMPMRHWISTLFENHMNRGMKLADFLPSSIEILSAAVPHGDTPSCMCFMREVTDLLRHDLARVPALRQVEFEMCYWVDMQISSLELLLELEALCSAKHVLLMFV
ncbi:hypothetical protein MMC11_005275 [Xylographa trunciseda]|nr:hypothetical protein [Xylographa trunciseda]